jgi:hypothetical protein
VGVHIHNIRLGKGAGKAGTYNLGTVKAKDSIYNVTVVVITAKLLGNGIGLGKTGFLRSHINVVVAVAVAGSKMATYYTKIEVFALGFKLKGIGCGH